jgi:hypothetical protein
MGIFYSRMGIFYARMGIFYSRMGTFVKGSTPSEFELSFVMKGSSIGYFHFKASFETKLYYMIACNAFGNDYNAFRLPGN